MENKRLEVKNDSWSNDLTGRSGVGKEKVWKIEEKDILERGLWVDQWK
jgi:hypothetical protein